jgi:hypothetical protein
MLSNDLCLNLIGIDVKMLSQVNTETQAIEEGAGTQQAIMPRACASDLRQGIRGIGYNQYHRAGRRAHDTRNDVAMDFGVLVQEPQSAFRVIAVRGAPAFSLIPAVIITNAASARSS